MYGIIDIGSNSIRLMKCDGENCDKKVITTRLAEGMVNGILADESIARSVSAIADLVNNFKGEAIYAYATEAVRSAVNKADFIERVRKACGIDIDVLSGENEAKCSYYGAMNGFPRLNGLSAVVDIGGASTEIVIGDGGEPVYAKSAPCGIVRVKDNCAEDDNRINKFLEEKLIAVHKNAVHADRLIGIGGTITSLAAMALELKVYDRDIVHGYTLERERITELKEIVKTTPIEKRINILGLNPTRTQTIYQGINILERVMDIIGADEVIASESDNLEGYALLKGIN